MATAAIAAAGDDPYRQARPGGSAPPTLADSSLTAPAFSSDSQRITPQALAALDADRSLQKESGYLPQERYAPRPSGYGLAEAGGDVDVTVMAYAQWLSEMKQQATNARYQQQAELDLMRDAINANNGELVDFKRHSSQVVQQLQGQVTEIRAKLSDAFAEMSQQNRQRTEAEQRTGNVIGGLQQALSSRQMDQDANRRSTSDQLEKLTSEVDSKMKTLDGEVGNFKRALTNSQEQTIAKFSEVDKAMSIFLGNINGTRQELSDTTEDWKKSQNLLGQAISTLSQDLANFQKHSSTVMNKLQSDTYHFEELGREKTERIGRIEAQLVGIQQSVYSNANEIILIKDDKAAPARTPQRRPSPRNDIATFEGSVPKFERSEGQSLLDFTGVGFGGATSASAPSFSSATPGVLQQGTGSAGLRPQAAQQPVTLGSSSSMRNMQAEGVSASSVPSHVMQSLTMQPGAIGGVLPSAPRLPGASMGGTPPAPVGGAFNPMAGPTGITRSATPSMFNGASGEAVRR